MDISDETRGTTRAGYTRRAVVLLALATMSISACNDTNLTGPEADAQLRKPRLTEYRCVRQNGPSVPADTTEVDENGQCAPGFDSIPWM